MHQFREGRGDCAHEHSCVGGNEDVHERVLQRGLSVVRLCGGVLARERHCCTATTTATTTTTTPTTTATNSGSGAVSQRLTS
jgi:hypothetical protein